MGAQKNLYCVNWINSIRIVVQDAGLAHLGETWNAKGVCAPFSRVYFVGGGGGTIRLPSGPVRLLPNRVYLIPSWTVFDYVCEDWMDQLYFHVFLKQPNGLDLFSQVSGCYETELSPEDMASAFASFGRQDAESACRVQECLYRVVLRMAASIAGMQDAAGRGYSSRTLDLFAYIQKNLSFRITVGTLAEVMRVSASTLAKRFRAETGMPLGKYIDQLLVQEIQRRLLFGNESISQIASSLDFCDQFYMSHYFKRQTRLSPTLYRSRFKGIS